MVKRLTVLAALMLVLIGAAVGVGAVAPGEMLAYDGYCARERRATCLLDLRTGARAYWAPHSDTYGDWLPDMSQMIYAEGYPATIRQRAAHSSDGVDVVKTDRSVILPTWSPDGASVAYFSMIEPDQYGLHVIPLGGTHELPTAIANGVVQRPPLWSPGGTHMLFFTHQVRGAGFSREIWLFDVAGASLTQVDRLTNGGMSWSPDGSQMLYAVSRRSGSLLRIADLDGNVTRQINLTDPPEYVIEPSWSPDGQRVAYLAQHQIMSGISREYLEVVDLESGEKQRLHPQAFDPIAPPTWLDDTTILQPLTSDAVFDRSTGILRVDVETGQMRRYAIPRLRQYYGVFSF